jgi:hypothetical protein
MKTPFLYPPKVKNARKRIFFSKNGTMPKNWQAFWNIRGNG